MGAACRVDHALSRVRVRGARRGSFVAPSWSSRRCRSGTAAARRSRTTKSPWRCLLDKCVDSGAPGSARGSTRLIGPHRGKEHIMAKGKDAKKETKKPKKDKKK